MSGSVSFYRNKRGTGARMLIGWRKRGYSPIWYEPIGDRDDKDKDIGLYAKPSGEPTKDDPMAGEVIWHPWFNVTSGESSNIRERAIIHKQDLEDFYYYLLEKDEDKVAEMEEGLNDPGKMRRYAFLTEARKWKRKDMRARRKRRSRRAGVASGAGMDLNDVEINSDSSDDSGVEMEEEEQREQRSARKKRKQGNMGPPPRPNDSNKKRKGKVADGGGGNRANNGRMIARTPDDIFGSPLVMSGGRGIRDDDNLSSISRDPSVNPANQREISLDDDSFDNRDPREHNSSPAGSRIDPSVGCRGRRGSQNYVHPTFETETNDSGDEETLARRRVAELNGEGVDPEEAIERLKRQTSAAYQKQTGSARSPGGRYANGRPSGRNAAQEARAHWENNSLGCQTTHGQNNGAATRLTNGASRASTEQSDLFATDTPTGADQLSNEDMERLQRGSILGDSSRVGGPLLTDDDEAEVDAMISIERTQPGAHREGSPAEEVQREDDVNANGPESGNGANGENGEAGADDEREDPKGEDE